MKEYNYCVANFLFTITLPQHLNIDELLPSFIDFKCEKGIQAEKIFNFTAISLPLHPIKEKTWVQEEIINDMGYIYLQGLSEGYRVDIQFTKNSITHSMQMNTHFSFAVGAIKWEDPNAGNILCSMIRIVYSQAIIYRNAISLHASVINLKGNAYLFMGKSGTGKSTHSNLWIENIVGSELLNDDNPTIRIIDKMIIAYGTPWSGKTPCYKNKQYPVKGIVRLSQAKENNYSHLKNIDAFIAILPGCSVIQQDELLHNKLCETLIQITKTTNIGRLECLPTRESALLCFEEITNN